MNADAVVTPGIEWLALLPVIAMGVAGLVVVLEQAMIRTWTHLRVLGLVSGLVGAVVTGGLLVWQWRDLDDADGGYTTFAGAIGLDRFAVAIGMIVVVSTILVLLLSFSYVKRTDLPASEYVALILFAATGMLAMSTANDLIVVFVALEVLSIPLYVLAALDRRRLASQEAGFKYFLLGAFSSAIFLFGIALAYGTTGTTRLVGAPGEASIAGFLASNVITDNALVLASIALMLVGLGFKVAAVPFHQWTPDVYEGSPTPVTAFMASATKAAGFAAMVRVLYGGFSTYAGDWRPMLWGLAFLSLVVGSVAAIVQTDVKRMLAYSSITHAGYVLIGVYAATEAGVAAAVFYLGVYAFMTIGSFAVVALVARREDADHSLASYRSLASKEPVLAGLFTFFLLAQAGVPLTGGFVAKLAVFEAAIDVGGYWIALVGLLTAVASAYMYLRIVVSMFVGADNDADAPDEEHGGGVAVAVRTEPRVRVDLGSGIVLVVCAAAVLALGLFPERALDLASQATLLFP